MWKRNYLNPSSRIHGVQSVLMSVLRMAKLRAISALQDPTLRSYSKRQYTSVRFYKKTIFVAEKVDMAALHLM